MLTVDCDYCGKNIGRDGGVVWTLNGVQGVYLMDPPTRVQGEKHFHYLCIVAFLTAPHSIPVMCWKPYGDQSQYRCVLQNQHVGRCYFVAAPYGEQSADAVKSLRHHGFLGDTEGPING